MNKTTVAIFDDITVARQVVEDLVNADFPRSSISLVTNDAHNQYGHLLAEDYVAKEDAVTAGEGAGFGAIIGAMTGVLVGLAALTIPGIGLLIVAGPVAAGLTGAVAGALTGGMVGALVKSGIPEDAAPYYAEGIKRGCTLISVETAHTMRAEVIMNRRGAVNIYERSAQWQQGGWPGAGVNSSPSGSLTSTDDTATPSEPMAVAELMSNPIDRDPVNRIASATLPLNGEVDRPMHDEVHVPLNGEVDMPMHDEVHVPLNGEVDMPLNGEVDRPMHDEVHVPLNGEVDMPMHDEVHVPLNGEVDRPMHDEVDMPRPVISMETPDSAWIPSATLIDSSTPDHAETNEVAEAVVEMVAEGSPHTEHWDPETDLH